MQLTSASEDETFALGRRIASALTAPRVLLLFGELGAGKTAFTRGFASGLGMADLSQVHSPSFTLVNQYETPAGTLYHIDLYRLETSRDLYSIGLEELLWEGTWAVVEWAERLPWTLQNPLLVRIRVEPDESRSFEINID